MSVPISFERGESETCEVWRSAAAMPAARIASTTFFAAAVLAVRAARAVAPSVWTPKKNEARSGTVRTEPVPVTVSPTGGSSSALCAGSGRPTPASAPTTSARAANATMWTSFMGRSSRSMSTDLRRRGARSSHRRAALRAEYRPDVRYRFVDCRWTLADPAAGRHAYLAAHIPGASFLDLETEL